MKTLILVRHSEPVKDKTIPTVEIPLCESGYIKADELFTLGIFRCVDKVYTSPYRRAYDTAVRLNRALTVDTRLRERDAGNPITLNAEFWKRQYEDYDYKNRGGESLNDVKERMTLAISEILSGMSDGETVAVVSHAAAICALLLNWCLIEVTDEVKKLRRITHNARIVLNGKISTPSAFVLTFEDEKIFEIRYIDVDRST